MITVQSPLQLPPPSLPPIISSLVSDAIEVNNVETVQIEASQLVSPTIATNHKPEEHTKQTVSRLTKKQAVLITKAFNDSRFDSMSMENKEMFAQIATQLIGQPQFHNYQNAVETLQQ